MSTTDTDDNPRDRTLLHISHKHGLVLQELSENCSTLECFICLSSVKDGLAYHCPDCNDFFLHKYCAQLPSTIQHRFHPHHKLELVSGYDMYSRCCDGCCSSMAGVRYHYQCDECRIALHVGCAAETLFPTHRQERKHEHEDKEEETIQQIAHEHPLESFYLNSPCPSYCSACKEKITGRAYGCRTCIFLLHESCALAPQEINNHPFHPQHPLTLFVDFKDKVECRTCRYESDRFVYGCNQCCFNLDISCAVYVERHHTSVPRDDHDIEKDRQEFWHFFHPHPLAYCYTKGHEGLACDFCEEKIAGDFYVCGEHCSFMIHKSCAELPREMMHPLHPNHPLIVQGDFRDCALCGYDLKILFKCQECNFGLHPRCALQSLSVSEEELAINIHHIHEYPMRLRTSFGGWYEKCDICDGKCRDLTYKCELDCPEYTRIHKICAELPRESQFSVHPQHPLVLLSKTRVWSKHCASCHELISAGFNLHCDTCKLQFHVSCAMMEPTLKYQRHEHALTHFELIDSDKKYDVLCNVCGSDCRIDIYRCIPCNYNLHYGCSRLPSSIKHEWHVHPMVLRDKYINPDFDEQYCDLCETVRHPEHGVYYCVECRCATHIDCVIPKLNLEKRRRMDEIKLRKLDLHIFSLEAQKEESWKELEAMRKKFERLAKDLEDAKEKRLEMLSSMTMMQSEEEFCRT